MIRYKNYDCDLIIRRYSNGLPALQLISAKTRHNRKINLGVGQPILTLSTNLNIAGLNLPPNHFLLKDDGIISDLHGISIKITGEKIYNINICKINDLTI